MTAYVFTGPTLNPEDARAELDAVYLPPVSQGDVYRVTIRQPRAIGIIDGYFERVPAVWHKEILWAMTQGVHVFGSGSMGALRAAELAPFGMQGVGAIFEAYRAGALDDDDEVAVAHGLAETGYRPLSEAMVDIRRTLADAERGGVISPATRAGLERIAKELFYPERSYPLVLRLAADYGLPQVELDALGGWLRSGRVSQKREDALAMLRVMRERLADGLEPMRVRFSFEHTDFWDRARRLAGDLHLDAEGGAEWVRLDALLTELRLEGDAYVRACRGSMLRVLLAEEARRRGAAVTSQVLEEAIETFRRERGLLAPEDTERWMLDHHLTREQFIRLVEEEARAHRGERSIEREAVSRLPDYLRVAGEYPRLLARARDKRRRLELSGLESPALADVGLTEDQLLRWYFEERLGRPVAADVAGYARAAGFRDRDAFTSAVLREFCYSRKRDP